MTSLAKNNWLLIFSIISIVFITSCSQKNTDSNSLSVTIEPQRYFLEQLVGDKYKVTSLVPSGANPESFDPTPSQMVALDKSKTYFKIGFLGVENSLVDKVKDQSRLQIVDCSNGIEIIEDGHQHSDNEDIAHHGHDGGDPHYWSSVNSAKVIIKNMYDQMLRLNAENENVYTNNYQEELKMINKTDSIIKELIKNTNTKAFVIYHPALSYFARDYNLEQLSIEQDGKNPSPSQLKKLIDEAKEKNVKAVFIQAEYDSKNAEVVAEQIGAKTYSINLLNYDWHEEIIKIAKAIANEQ